MEFQEQGFGSVDRGFPHPFVAFFHVFFRTAALIVYLLGSAIYSASFIGIFVSVVLLLSLDFWTVKNITGRILVGLRWWNYINDSGESEWVFESKSSEMQSRLNSGETRLFWIALILAPAFWILFFITAVIRFNFQWLILVIIGITLTMSNLLGYMRCRFGNTTTVTEMANSYIKQQMFSNLLKSFTSKAAGGVPQPGPNQFI